ncbi:MAG: succinate dehydrogenase, hydrophobic membrane anchor protein [Xanthobacteraceae bacterium]|nr:succinate dehydrogenase, hydrophobic membrane anchor protein [Xanthobacteraceae bacterium]QYK44876.1 MAG: succinate dehydrogenase, hydrophobic membrane anchor protein [Xanthobacteraceae bacterium]HMN52099.1 succinate dehydrogenase, hydrophobic membrane anchor protein [Xanthobacteraceae bacterium]
MRTPLSRVRGLGAAHHGTEHFWLQRVTAAANAILLIVLIGVTISLVGRGHAGVIATLSRPLIAVLLLAAIISVAIHMRLGMQIVIEDYVHSPGRKVLLLLANTFFTWGVALACAFAILKISFGFGT